MGVGSYKELRIAIWPQKVHCVLCHLSVWIWRSTNAGRAFQGPYKSEYSLMTGEAELHGRVFRMARPILSLIGNKSLFESQVLA